MPPLTREQLAVRRTVRRRRERLQHRRLLLYIGGSVLAAGLLALALGLSIGGSPPGVALAAAPGPVAPPVAMPPPQASAPSSDAVLATAGGVQLRLPVDGARLTAVLFRPVDDPGAVAMSPSDQVSSEVSSDDGELGSATSSVDVGAPAGTPVYAPVDGTIASVAPYTVAGRQEGYEIAITPRDGSGVVVEMSHLDAPAAGPRPSVGAPVRAGGGSAIGQVRDFSHVAQQELARYTSDSGNHVHLEVLRTGSDLLP
jgi:hypothetical protein